MNSKIKGISAMICAGMLSWAVVSSQSTWFIAFMSVGTAAGILNVLDIPPTKDKS